MSLDEGAINALEEKRPADAPAIVRLSASIETDVNPLTAYTTLTGGEAAKSHSFLLESADKIDASDPDGAFSPSSARPDRHARYSFVGYDPIAVVTYEPEGVVVESLETSPLAAYIDPVGDTLVDRLRTTLPDLPRIGFENGDRQRLDGGLVGFIAYDAVYDMWLEDVGLDRPDSPLPDAQFALITRTLVFDELSETCELLCTPLIGPKESVTFAYEAVREEAHRIEELLEEPQSVAQGGFDIHTTQAEPESAYATAVERAKEHVLDGDIYQGVLSRKHELNGLIDPRGFYAALRDVNPSPYMYLLEFDERTIVGASPETLVSVRGETVTSNPIAGTCPRGNSPVEDRRLAGEMLADEKELAEHTMLVDLARNDVRRVARPGTVRVDEFMNVLKYSHVQHIESTVTGELAEDADAYDATRATFPAGTLSGAPKIRAMEIIDELETTPRGIYGGGVGYFSWTGDVDMAIAIRSATIEHGNTDEITVRAGAGIVADSDPVKEFEETEAKMNGVLTALAKLSDDGRLPTPEVH